MKQEIAAIILAAGYSSRMKEFKPLLSIGDHTVIEHSVKLFRDAGIENIRVVAGYKKERIMPELLRLRVVPVINKDYKDGMFSSVKTGVGTLENNIKAFFILPVDIPFVETETIRLMIKSFAKGNHSIIHPVYREIKGHPPLISSGYKEQILNWKGLNGLKGFFKTCESDSENLNVDDKYILFDIDTPEEYRKVLSSFYKDRTI